MNHESWSWFSYNIKRKRTSLYMLKNSGRCLICLKNKIFILTKFTNFMGKVGSAHLYPFLATLLDTWPASHLTSVELVISVFDMVTLDLSLWCASGRWYYGKEWPLQYTSPHSWASSCFTPTCPFDVSLQLVYTLIGYRSWVWHYLLFPQPNPG